MCFYEEKQWIHAQKIQKRKENRSILNVSISHAHIQNVLQGRIFKVFLTSFIAELQMLILISTFPSPSPEAWNLVAHGRAQDSFGEAKSAPGPQ